LVLVFYNRVLHKLLVEVMIGYGWDALLNSENNSSQKSIHAVLSKIYSHMNEILALVKEDRVSLNEITDKLSSLEERIKALEKRVQSSK
jgi:flagellin-specific chaperone FliS